MHTREHPAVIYSSLAYCVVGMYAFVMHATVPAVLMGCAGIASYYHHRSPHNTLVRIFDWACAAALVFYTTTTVPPIFGMYVLALTLVLVWGVSFVAFHTKKMYLYTVTHTLWHVASAVFVGVTL